MTEQRKDRIEGAAVIFAFFTREKHRIATIFNVTPQAIGLWSKTEVFHKKLDTLCFSGDRSFLYRKKRDVERDTEDDLNTARAVYEEAKKSGIKPHNRIRFVSDRTGLKIRRLRYWKEKFDWDQEEGIDIEIGDIGYP